MPLNAKQRLFVNEYIKSRNATKAARAAGYSSKTAHSQGPRLLENAEIRAAIDKRLERAAEKAELSVAEVLKELRSIGFARLKDAYAPDGNLLPVHEMPEDVQAALVGLESDEILAGPRGMKVKVGVSRKVKMADKIRALELLGKHLKMFVDVQEVTGKDGGPQVILTMPADGSEAETE